MSKRLVIVESPTKARTLERFLGDDYVVESSIGHVRDLPASAAEIPAALKKEPWARLGVNVDDGFKPLYVVQPDKKKKISELKKLLKGVDELLLATDEDREGEAISWHLVEVLKPTVPVRRMVFHEITREAILRSLTETREIDAHLVDAQETRRIIDRLFGYEVSPVLWKKVAPKLSAGRVQSVAVRMIVDRERARMRFVPADFWDLAATFLTNAGESFAARLATLGGERVAGGKDFDPDSGELKKRRVRLLDGEAAASLRAALLEAEFSVLSVESKSWCPSPPPPFTTSTLQQEGNRKLGFDARRTMRAAQRLYENGFITYMRTDSVALSNDAIRLTRTAIEKEYGPEYVPDSPRHFKTNVKNAQEAHEAIRPAGSRVAPIGVVRQKLGGDEARLYELIWKRTMACQMRRPRGHTVSVRVGTEVNGEEAVFLASGKTIEFPGYLRAYAEGSDDPEATLAGKEKILPPVREGDPVRAGAIEAEDHRTAPPPRLTEAALVKMMEDSGIGRPSTYASIIDTIQRREYTFKKGTALVPTFVAFSVVSLLEQHFSDLVETSFTARMEDRLDEISRGEFPTLRYLEEFYHGNSTPGLKPLLDQKIEDIDAREICTIRLGTDAEGREVRVRVGRYGPYLQREDTTAPIPEGTCPDELTVERAGAILAEGKQGEEPIGRHGGSGEPVYVKRGRFGPYVQLGDPVEGSKKKPKMVSLLKGMSPEEVTLEVAEKLLELPRLLGKDLEGNEVHAHQGRYGPYIKRGADTRSLTAADDLLEIDLSRALELLAEEKKGRGARKTAKPLRVFEKVEALEGKDINVLDGRYGPYVSDGKVNASLPKGKPVEQLTLEEALELLESRRNAPKKKRARKK